MLIGNQQLRVDVRVGDGTGTPVLMCSGIGASYELLQPLVDALDPGIDIIRFDAPGVGGSPVGALPHGFPQLASMLGRVLDELGYHRVDELGFSWGGALAQQFAVQRGRRLRLIGTNAGALSVPGSFWQLARLATPHGFRENARAMMAGSMRGGDSRARSDNVRWLFRDTIAVSGRGFLYQLAAAASWSSLPSPRARPADQGAVVTFIFGLDDRGGNPADALFPTGQGRPLSADAIQWRLNKLTKTAM